MANDSAIEMDEVQDAPIVEAESMLQRAERAKREADAAYQEALAAVAGVAEHCCGEIAAAVQMVEIPKDLLTSGIVAFRVEVKVTSDGPVYGVTLLDTAREPGRKARSFTAAESTAAEGEAVPGIKTPAFFGFKTGDVLVVLVGKNHYEIVVADQDSHSAGLRLGGFIGSFNKIAKRILSWPKDRTIRGTKEIFDRTDYVKRGAAKLKIESIRVKSDVAESGFGESWKVA